MRIQSLFTKSVWVFAAVVQLQYSIAAETTPASQKNNITSSTNRTPFTRQSSRHLHLPWRHLKLPAHPPKLSPRYTTSPKESSTTTVIPTEITEQESLVDKRIDIFDSSSSENNPRSVVWPLRRRIGGSKRFRLPVPTTETPIVLWKLLQPKPTRPAIYSLDGFVPKPSIQNIVTTEAPLYLRKTDLQFLSSVPRRRKINRFSKNGDDDEDYHVDEDVQVRRKKPVSRYTAFARKGIPGEDYPVFTYIPQTNFQCGAQQGPGLYADPYTDCQVWHMCPGGNLAPRHSFLCPNGTIFNQKKRICDWWYNVDCKRHSRDARSSEFNFHDMEMDNMFEKYEELL